MTNAFALLAHWSVRQTVSVQFSSVMSLCMRFYRYIAVCYPFRRDQYCTTRRASIVICCLSVGVTSLHVVQAYFWHYSAHERVCDIRPELAQHVWSIWSWTTELLVFLLVPLAILMLNIAVIVARQRINDKMEKLLEGGRCSYYIKSYF